MKVDRSRAVVWRYFSAVLSGILLIPAVAFLSASPAAASTQTATVGDFTLTFDDEDPSAGATITGYSGPGGALVLPSAYVYTGSLIYDIVGVADDVFESAGITSVSFPDSLKSIGAQAFRGNSLSSVTFPAGIEAIGSNAFADNDLSSVTLPDGFDFTPASYQAFMNNDITTVSLPDSITVLPLGIFRNNGISNLVVPDAVTEIGENAFLNNEISDVVWGTAVEVIGYGAFWGNDLTSLVLPDSLRTIGEYAFYLNELTEVTIPASIDTIGDSAFDENLLDTVHFLGDTPSFTGDGPWIPGADITYLCTYDEAHGGGFSSPVWNDGFEDHDASTNTVTATFVNEHGSETTQTVACGDLLTEPDTPIADGFDFDGWLINGDVFSFDTFSPAEDVTIEASWVPTNTGGSGDDDDHDGSLDDDGDETADESDEASDGKVDSDVLTATGDGLKPWAVMIALLLLTGGGTMLILARLRTTAV